MFCVASRTRQVTRFLATKGLHFSEGASNMQPGDCIFSGGKPAAQLY